MELKQPQPGAMASAAGMGGADKQISFLSQRILPSIPHLFSVPTKTPYQPTFIYENQNTPFDQKEVMALQYMTLISNGDRGVGHTMGNWQESLSPPLSSGAQSNTSTPNPQREAKKPSVKMSIADYKNLKTTGLKPLPKPSTAMSESKHRSDTTDLKPGHARSASATSNDTPMGRMPSSEGYHRQDGTGASGPVGHKAPVQEERHAPSQTTHPEARDVEKNRATVNGHSTRESQPKDANSDRASSRPNSQTKEPPKHPPSPGPQSPRRDNSEPRQQKRPHASSDASHPEKRAKIEHADARTPPVPRKSEASSEQKPSTARKAPAAAPSRASPPPKKDASADRKPNGSKTSASISPEKPLNLPKILSPLPDDLVIPPETGPTGFKMPESEKSTPPKSPSQKSKGVTPNSTTTKPTHPKKVSSTSSPYSTPKLSQDLPPFVLPKLLSPDLPDIVEAELLRLKEKGSSGLNTVEARHEKVRQPGALGVAQKTQRPKVGHPPKKSHGESSKKVEEKEVDSFVVKIRYKKRLAKDIGRILALPSKSIKKHEAERLRERSASAAPPVKGRSDSEDDTPIAASRSTKAPATSTAKKRPPSDLSSRNEPAPKRAKGAENTDVSKASTPTSRPTAQAGASASKEKGLMATPKKGDAMKSVAMRRVDSSDGHARTPQGGNSSTPASAEKSRINGLTPQVVSQELTRAAQENDKFFAVGTTLKRKMDAVLKKPDATESERKSGVMSGIEGLLGYMLAFHARDKTSTFRNQAPRQENWEEFFMLWNFIGKKTPKYPELHALLGQLGAVSREQWNKANMEQPKERRDWEKMVNNLRERDKLWAQCKRDERLILDLGVNGTLGPWSSVGEAVGFGIATLTYYAEKQGKGVEWKQDPSFSMGYARKFMSET